LTVDTALPGGLVGVAAAEVPATEVEVGAAESAGCVGTLAGALTLDVADDGVDVEPPPQAAVSPTIPIEQPTTIRRICVQFIPSNLPHTSYCKLRHLASLGSLEV